MSSAFKSKKSVIFALVSVALLSTIVLLVGAQSLSLPEAEKSLGSKVGSVNDKSQTFTITQCEDYSINVAHSITDVNGFVTVEPRTSATPEIILGTHTPGPAIGIYEFVLQPGSTGEITMVYDFCPSEGKILDDNSTNYVVLDSTELRNIFDQNNSTNEGMYVLNEDAQANIDRLIQVPGNSTGVRIYPSEIAKVNDHSVEVTYTISANSDAEKVTYITANFYDVCPGEILTIGDEVNDESSEWASGPFYGCAG